MQVDEKKRREGDAVSDFALQPACADRLVISTTPTSTSSSHHRTSVVSGSSNVNEDDQGLMRSETAAHERDEFSR